MTGNFDYAANGIRQGLHGPVGADGYTGAASHVGFLKFPERGSDDLVDTPTDHGDGRNSDHFQATRTSKPQSIHSFFYCKRKANRFNHLYLLIFLKK
jgi:hypothetical protein